MGPHHTILHIKRWARPLLPNRHIARCAWIEKWNSREQIRSARMLKMVCLVVFHTMSTVLDMSTSHWASTSGTRCVVLHHDDKRCSSSSASECQDVNDSAQRRHG
ncbi:hypothetical protein PAXRUDRAFT_700874 [Paxillus rubicundulus Ve08.2h10]|uniref:Uncharacterized protein n=1 Tax=Paxillus rubicundulus Ve08.2h10 TaxID=930991 RepID=A0A0D0CLZ8_9AGAM|nr:hypothetical protein PAXRUDRAFT_700874 [Paxillus rubicundulus Ve08.2h10]